MARRKTAALVSAVTVIAVFVGVVVLFDVPGGRLAVLVAIVVLLIQALAFVAISAGMSRRKLVTLISAAIVLDLCIAAVALVVGVTQTGTGQDFVRRTIAQRIAPNVRGKLYVGRISGSFLGGVTIDSVEIRERDDSLFAAAGRIHIEYDVRDLLDRRILLKHLLIERPVVRIVQAETGEWN